MTTPADLRELVALHALGALEAEEAAVEAAAAADPEVARELAEQRHLVAALAPDEGAPDTLGDRILAAATDTSSVDRPATTTDDAPVVELRGRSGPPAWVRLTLAAAAVVALLAIGVGLMRQDRDSSTAELAADVLADPQARVVRLTGDDGRTLATAGVTDDGTAYLVPEDLPALGPDEAYQLWMLPSDAAAGPISLGLVDPTADAVAFRLPAGASGVALSREPATGSVQPTAVVAAGALT